MNPRFAHSIGLALVLLAATALGACSSAQTAYHEILMKGHVVKEGEDGPIICIGHRDGAKEGQQLTVYRHQKRPTNPKSSTPVIRRQVGTVEVIRIFDEHYAQVKVLSGTALNGDSVELDD